MVLIALSRSGPSSVQAFDLKKPTKFDLVINLITVEGAGPCYVAELGYDVTVVKDATADYSDEMMHAALDINLPNYASAIVTTSQIVASISAATVMRAD